MEGSKDEGVEGFDDSEHERIITLIDGFEVNSP